MVTDTREIEMKYEAGPETVLPPLEDLPRVASEAAPDEVKLEAEYYDTADLRLLRAGVTLRRRRGGKDAGWHLKLPGRAADPPGDTDAAGPRRPDRPGRTGPPGPRVHPGARRSRPSRGSRPCAGPGP